VHRYNKVIRAVIDEIPGEGREIDFGPAASNNPTHATLIGQQDGVGSGVLVKFQWLVSAGTGQINSFRIMLDGIPDIRVVQ